MADREIKCLFLEELAGLYVVCSLNWCVGGDFNVVKFSYDKSNRGRETSSMKMFNEFIRESKLTDPELINASFTR